MNKKICFLCIILLFNGFLTGASASGTENVLQITAAVEEKEFHIGDRIKLTLIAENTGGFEILFPDKPENPGDFSFIESYPVEARWPRKPVTGREYVLSIYDAGTHVIPPIPVGYRRAGETDWRTAESPQVPVEIKSLLTGEDKDIRDLKGLIVYGSDLGKMILIIAIIFAVFSISWAIWLRRKKLILAGEDRRRKTAYEIAYQQLKELEKLNLPAKGLIKEYYTGLSDIIRRYLENRFSFRAPEMTTEEFMEAIKNSQALTEEQKELLKEFLSNCDMVKFAKYGPTPLEMLDSFHAAERLVDQTRLLEEEEKEV